MVWDNRAGSSCTRATLLLYRRHDLVTTWLDGLGHCPHLITHHGRDERRGRARHLCADGPSGNKASKAEAAPISPGRTANDPTRPPTNPPRAPPPHPWQRVASPDRLKEKTRWHIRYPAVSSRPFVLMHIPSSEALFAGPNSLINKSFQPSPSHEIHHHLSETRQYSDPRQKAVLTLAIFPWKWSK